MDILGFIVVIYMDEGVTIIVTPSSIYIVNAVLLVISQSQCQHMRQQPSAFRQKLNYRPKIWLHQCSFFH